MKLLACRNLLFLALTACGLADVTSAGMLRRLRQVPDEGADGSESSTLQIDTDDLEMFPDIRESHVVPALDAAEVLAQFAPVVGSLILSVRNGYALLLLLKELLDGGLPCTIDLDHGVVCRRLSTDAGVADILLQILRSVPSILLPGFLRDILYYLLGASPEIEADLALGGVEREIS